MMPSALVTLELVTEAAEALIGAGEEPTIIAVQQRIGGGSYTTVKKFLDQWKATRSAAISQAVPVPEVIVTRGAAFVQSLWGAAADLAEQQTLQIREDAQRQVREARAALAEAEAAIGRLETEQAAQQRQLTEQTQAIAQRTDELAQVRSATQVAEARAAEQTQRGDELRRELELAHQQIAQLTEELTQARAAALDHARLMGEHDALQRQLQDQARLIERLTGAAGRA